jgi:hypothetical protein
MRQEALVRRISIFLLLLVSFDALAAADASSASGPCRGVRGAELWAHTELYFGMSIQPEGTLISEEQYQQFIDLEVTPRFPEGFTVLSGRGQFRNSSGVIIREPNKVLIVFYPFSPTRSAALEAIRAAYVGRFRQESVMRVDDAPACVAF